MSQIPPLQKPPGYRDPTLPIKRPQPPPHRANLPTVFYPRKSRKNHCRRCCCCFCIFFGVVILFIIAAVGFLYVYFEPKLPDINLKSLQFTKLNVTTTPDGPVLDAQSTADVVIRNPNLNLKLVYGRTELTLNSQEGASMGIAYVPGFVQDKNNFTVLKFKIKSGQMLLTDQQANELKNGSKNKNLKVSAEIRIGIGTGYGGWISGKPQVNVLCGAMSLKQIEGGRTPNCRIRVLRWFYIY